MFKNINAVDHLDVMIQVSPFFFTVSGISTIAGLGFAGFLVYTYFFQTPKIEDNSSSHSNISSPSSISSEMSDLSSVIPESLQGSPCSPQSTYSEMSNLSPPIIFPESSPFYVKPNSPIPDHIFTDIPQTTFVEPPVPEPDLSWFDYIISCTSYFVNPTHLLYFSGIVLAGGAVYAIYRYATPVVPVVNTNADLTKNLLDMPASVPLSSCKSNLDNNLIDLTISPTVTVSTNYEYHFLWNESINIELHKFFFDFFL